jgi:periplasmic protein TonB
MERHVYRPPQGRFTGLLGLAGGLLATVAVFVAIPLSQKLSDLFDASAPMPPDMMIEPPEELVFEADEPPPETENEPEPEDLLDEPSDLDLGLEVPDLAVGSGGGFLMEIPKFGMRGDDDAFGSGDLDSSPMPITRLPPVYPSGLLGRGIGGRVVVSCQVDVAGKVSSARIRQSSGHADLDKAALDAVAKWKFKPATKGGRPIQATLNIPFNFEVKR